MTGPASKDTQGAIDDSAVVNHSLDTRSRSDAELQSYILKMPKPGDRNAPTFDPDKPEGLVRFFERMDDWFAEENIRNDLDKKRHIVKYLDADSELEWSALSMFTEGTFTEFKDQVMSSYPGAEALMRGSMCALRRRIDGLRSVAIEERRELLCLIRIMTAEVVKLEKISPPIHTNRELVELFLSKLTFNFAVIVANKLSMHRMLETMNRAEGSAVNRDPEDMYELGEVMTMAKGTSLEYANPFGKYLWRAPDETNVKLAEKIARLMDTVSLQVQKTDLIERELKNLQSSFNSSEPSAHCEFDMIGVETKSSFAQRQYQTAQDCYYCGNSGHRISECSELHRHVDLGWVVVINDEFRLPNSMRIPRNSTKTMKEMVESLLEQNTSNLFGAQSVQEDEAEDLRDLWILDEVDEWDQYFD